MLDPSPASASGVRTSIEADPYRPIPWTHHGNTLSHQVWHGFSIAPVHTGLVEVVWLGIWQALKAAVFPLWAAARPGDYEKQPWLGCQIPAISDFHTEITGNYIMMKIHPKNPWVLAHAHILTSASQPSDRCVTSKDYTKIHDRNGNPFGKWSNGGYSTPKRRNPRLVLLTLLTLAISLPAPSNTLWAHCGTEVVDSCQGVLPHPTEFLWKDKTLSLRSTDSRCASHNLVIRQRPRRSSNGNWNGTIDLGIEPFSFLLALQNAQKPKINAATLLQSATRPCLLFPWRRVGTHTRTSPTCLCRLGDAGLGDMSCANLYSFSKSLKKMV